MKNLLKYSVLITIILLSLNVKSQKQTCAILNIDAQRLNLSPEQMGNLVRLEVEKLDTFEVMDRYDVTYLVKKFNLDLKDCYGKICLVETGEKLKTDKMISGSAELYGKTIIITLRLIDVKNRKIEKTQVSEFLDLQDELQNMVSLSLKKLLDVNINQIEYERLTKEFQFESSVNNPNKNKLNLSGPRLGATLFTGNTAKYMSEPQSRGGYDVQPVMFMFGYQFEVQYLNSGSFQALFEFIPTITGLDQGLIIPSVTVLNGLRHNVNGWEFALGPNISLTKTEKGYYKDGEWNLSRDYNGYEPLTYEEVKRLDSRGSYTLNSGFVFAVGKSFKSGSINIPVNAYIIPSRDGLRFGLSFGYNGKK